MRMYRREDGGWAEFRLLEAMFAHRGRVWRTVLWVYALTLFLVVSQVANP